MKAASTPGTRRHDGDVRVPNRKLTEEEAERYMLGSNAIHGEWDFDLLKGFEMDLLIDLGFDQKELDDIWNKSLKKEFDRRERA
jgi:hypothetical protein